MGETICKESRIQKGIDVFTRNPKTPHILKRKAIVITTSSHQSRLHVGRFENEDIIQAKEHLVTTQVEQCEKGFFIS